MVSCERGFPMKKLVLALTLLGMVAAGLSAEKAEKGFFLEQSIQASYNPLGLQFLTQAYYRLPLVNREGILWESTRIDLGLQNNLSPAYDMIGAYIDIEPIAIFDLALTAQAIGFFDALGFGFYTVSGYDAGFNDASLGGLTASNTLGYTLSATPTLKVAFGPVALADSFGLTYFSVDNGSGFFYERVNNCVLAKNDYELTNSAYLLVTVVPGVLAGRERLPSHGAQLRLPVPPDRRNGHLHLDHHAPTRLQRRPAARDVSHGCLQHRSAVYRRAGGDITRALGCGVTSRGTKDQETDRCRRIRSARSRSLTRSSWSR